MSTLKRNRPTRAPPSLGVLEFSSALNGDDPLAILQKLRQFVRVVGYERHLALSPPSIEIIDATTGGDVAVEEAEGENNDDGDDDDESVLSFDDDDDDAEPSKRQKLNTGTSNNNNNNSKSPSWKLDKNNYQVPFVGTSVSKGATGSVTPGVWPTGFLEAFLKHSPSGAELISNDFISAVPPLGGIHKGLCKEDSEFSLDGKRKSADGGQTRGKIISITLQTNYWMALSEWILGFVSANKLKKELSWGDWDEDFSIDGKSDKCAVPPPIMTILMKQRLPEWIDAIHKYTAQQHRYAQTLQKERQQLKKKQQQNQNNKKKQQQQGKQSKEDLDVMKEIQRQQDVKVEKRQQQLEKRQRREESLLLAALHNLSALCHLSNGTAREVLRKMTIATDGASKKPSGGASSIAKGGKFSGGKPTGPAVGGSSWMVQLFQQRQKSSSSHNSQTECLRLVCTLLETKDFIILSRLTEVPAWLIKQGDKSNKGGTRANNPSFGGQRNIGLAYIALRYGIQRLLEMGKENERRNGRKEEEDGDDMFQDQLDMYAQCTTRLLRDVRDAVLPAVPADGNSEKSDLGKKGFVLGIGATAELLSGDVLSNLTKLSILAPLFDATTESIQAVIDGSDSYGNLSPIESTAIEARRLLFLLLVDSARSPFLYGIHHNTRAGQTAKMEEQTASDLSQLSKALHGMLSNQGHCLSMKVFLGVCLTTTPALVPHFFRGLQLFDPKPTYRSLAALTFVESVLREAPPLPPQAMSLPVEQIISSLIPSCVTKTLLGKVIQSPSALFVSSGLKLIITLLRRTTDCISSLLADDSGTTLQLKSSISQAVINHLPEVSLLFSIPSRFDPFEEQEINSTPYANTLVVLQLCETVQCYAQLDPSLMTNVKFDWAKLVPAEDLLVQDQAQRQVFFSAEPLLQHRILQTLLMVSQLCQASFSSRMTPNLLSILVSATVPEVYSMARKLLLSLMEQEIFSQASSNPSAENDEVMPCHKYETSLWVDGTSADTIQEFVAMVEETKQHQVQHKIMISEAWAEASMGHAMPPLNVSSLLSSSICELLSGRNVSFSSKMSLLLVQIATKMLLFKADPKTFAAIIVYSVQGSIPGETYVADLYHAAKNLLCDGLNAGTSIASLTSGLFLPESCLNSIVTMVNGKRTQLGVSQFNGPVAMRQCLSLMKLSGKQNDKEIHSVVRRILIGILETGENVSDVVSRMAVMLNSQSLQSVDMESTLITLLSAVETKNLSLSIKPLLDCVDKLRPGPVGLEVTSELLRCCLVPANRENTFIAAVWQYCSGALQLTDAHTSDLRDFLLTILLQIIHNNEKSKNGHSLPPGAMFDLWVIVARNLTSKLAADFCLRLEECLAALFEIDDQQSWFVYQRLCSLSPRVFVDVCLGTLLQGKAFIGDHECTLLPSVLEYDCSSFSCLLDLFVSIDTDAKMEKLWDSGRFDLTAATFMLQTQMQKGASKITENALFEEATRIIGKRFLSLLSRQHETSEEGVTFSVILDVLEVICSKQLIFFETHDVLEASCPKQYIFFETEQCILAIFGRVENGQTTLVIDHEIKLMELASLVESSLKAPNTSMLLTKVFLRCCKLLPKYIKKMMRTKQVAEARWVESIIDTFSTLIDNAHYCHEMAVTQSSNSTVDNCIVACLKYGMMDSSGFASCSILAGCLKIVRLLMTKTHEATSQVLSGSFSASQVHAMAISHSSFQSSISSSSSNASNELRSEFCTGLTQQLEIVKLLLCTASLDANQVKIDNESWATILSVYKASTDSVDSLLRRLLFLYDQNGSFEIMINDLRWGPLATKHSLSKNGDQSNNVGTDESWEWFVDALEHDRIRSTLSQFPVADTLEPAFANGIECATDSDSEVRQERDFDSSSESDGDADDDSSMGESRPNAAPQANSHDLRSLSGVRHDLWRGAGEDPRYSPGFILPLILATLESHLPNDQVNCTEHSGDDAGLGDEFNSKNEEDTAQCQAFGNICRRVCDKGGVALAIASLSSRCPSIRKVAVSICGLFLKALQMQESHGMKLWRERPQQEMILSSIQRGLSVRRAIQMQRYESQEGVELGGMAETAHKHNIPMLPAVSTVFLAKSLLILSKPQDDLYGQINRYFLRLTDYHGAFQDCFGLPAFLSLYCSASDELSRCRTERNWALLTLKDSAVDDFCYRIISQHHVPELLMSSFDSLADDTESKSELYLTIDVIERLIQSGGARASDHLIKRQGLLSWLHGVVNWREVSSIFPYDALKCRFLKLITTVVKSFSCSKDSSGDDMAFYEKVPLANVVTRICLEGADTNGIEAGSTHESSMTLINMTCNALWAIYLADKGSQFTTTTQGSTTLNEIVSLLKKFVGSEEMFGKVLESVCDLPLVANDNDLPSAKILCDMALGFILEMRLKVLPNTIHLSLRRVHELFALHHGLADDMNIMSKVVKCRQLAVLTGNIDVWNRFLPYLTDDTHEPL